MTDSSRWTLRGPASVATRGKGMSIDSLVLANGAGGRMSLQGTIPDTGHAKILFSADSVALRDVGQVMQMLMLATVVEGRLMGINPYGQPGVEAYQRNMNTLLE